MLGFLLLYYVGKPFYSLAEEHQKSAWGYAILAIITYYVGISITGLLLGVAITLFSSIDINGINEYVLGIMCIPGGLLLAWLLYRFLYNRWDNTYANQDDNPNILDQNF
jgi:hypothetical protein